MDIKTAIDIKREKLGREMAKKKPNWEVVKRLKDSIRRHTREMEGYNRWKKRKSEKNTRKTLPAWQRRKYYYKT